VIGVWSDGKPQVFGYGKVTTPQGEMVPDGETLFEIGSITKAFTGVLLADAVARKEVALEDPANSHLPKDLAIRMKSDQPITLLQIATHRSGLPVQPPLIGFIARNSENPYADYTRPKLVNLMAELKPTREPGVKYEYSNLAVGLLGHALAHAAHANRYEELIQDRIARPLGMHDTGEAQTGAQKARIARGRTQKLEPTDPWEFATLEACGGLRSTANDLLVFAAANLGEKKTPLYPVLQASHERKAEAGSEKIDIGLCWHRLKLKSGEPVVWHNGGTGGFRSMLAFTPGTKRAVVVLCAVGGATEVDKLAFQVLTAIQPK
jgi:serine-type D-Ala-D-Ala carboxypeptidase/endopeptidase